MSAPTLFDHPARRTDPSTSHDAARVDRSTLVALVRRILAEHPEGLTGDELWLLTKLPITRHGSVVSARKRAGAVPSGRFAESDLGSKVIIWVLP